MIVPLFNCEDAFSALHGIAMYALCAATIQASALTHPPEENSALAEELHNTQTQGERGATTLHPCRRLFRAYPERGSGPSRARTNPAWCASLPAEARTNEIATLLWRR